MNIQLPVDSDIEIDGDRESREPRRFRWPDGGLVFVGGAVGTALREAFTLSIPMIFGIPVATFVINVMGAFLLGVLVETLLRRDPIGKGWRARRLFFGTGILGGFTTYSALATESARLISADLTVTSIAYPVGTVVVGAFATWVGIVWAAARNMRAAAGVWPLRANDQ